MTARKGWSISWSWARGWQVKSSQNTSILQWSFADCSLPGCYENGPDMHAVETTSTDSWTVLVVVLWWEGRQTIRFPSSNQAVPVKKTQECSVDVYCMCKLIGYTLLCRLAHKFYCGITQIWHLTNCNQSDVIYVHCDKYWKVIDAVINIYFSARFAVTSEILPLLSRS
jgi:hypothetical protein